MEMRTAVVDICSLFYFGYICMSVFLSLFFSLILKIHLFRLKKTEKESSLRDGCNALGQTWSQEVHPVLHEGGRCPSNLNIPGPSPLAGTWNRGASAGMNQPTHGCQQHRWQLYSLYHLLPCFLLSLVFLPFNMKCTHLLSKNIFFSIQKREESLKDFIFPFLGGFNGL